MILHDVLVYYSLSPAPWRRRPCARTYPCGRKSCLTTDTPSPTGQSRTDRPMGARCSCAATSVRRTESSTSLKRQALIGSRSAGRAATPATFSRGPLLESRPHIVSCSTYTSSSRAGSERLDYPVCSIRTTAIRAVVASLGPIATATSIVPDPDFHIKVPPACWAWDTRHIVSHAGVSHAQDLFDTQCWRELVTLCPVMASSKKNPAVSIAQDSCKTTQNPSGSRTRHARSPAPSIITSMPRGSMHLTVMRLESAPPRLARSMHYLELLAILANRCLDLVCAMHLVM